MPLLLLTLLFIAAYFPAAHAEPLDMYRLVLPGGSGGIDDLSPWKNTSIFETNGQLCGQGMHYVLKAPVASLFAESNVADLDRLFADLMTVVLNDCPKVESITLSGYVGDELQYAGLADINASGKWGIRSEIRKYSLR